MKYYRVHEIVESYQIGSDFISHCLKCQWIVRQAGPKAEELDEEDLSRLLLIQDLKNVFEVNDESIPVILHLLDELHYLRKKLKKAA